MRVARCLVAAGLLAVSSTCTASSLQSFERTYDLGKRALADHDFAGAETAFRSLLRFAPDHPDLLDALAQSEADAGEERAALATYARLVELGFGMRLVADPAFLSLRGDAGYGFLRAEALRQSRVISPAQEAFTLPERNFIPEGMAWDRRTGRFYISSTYLRKVAVHDEAGHFRDFTRTADHHMWQALGLKIDPERDWLLVCSGSDDPQMVDFEPTDLGKSGIFIYNLDTGGLVARHLLREPGIHLFNDLVEGPGGKVYVTDSDTGAVYALDLATGEFVRMTPVNSFIYPNGIAISPDGGSLYVADATGIDLLELPSSRIHRLPHPQDISTVGIDGLYFYHNYLIATQTDVKPTRVMAYHLASSLKRIDAAVLLERADPRMSSPTEGTIAGDSFYFIANSQQGAFDSDHRLWPMRKLTYTVVLRLELSGLSP